VAGIEKERQAVEEDQARAAFDHAASKVGAAEGDDDAPHPPAHSLPLAATATGSPLIQSPLEPRGGGGGGGGGLIFSPKEGPAATSDVRTSAGIDLSKEPPSLPASATPPYGVGHPSAQAGGVATGMRAAHAVVSTLKVGGGCWGMGCWWAGCCAACAFV
jgi:hypothetical protein